MPTQYNEIPKSRWSDLTPGDKIIVRIPHKLRTNDHAGEYTIARNDHAVQCEGNQFPMLIPHNARIFRVERKPHTQD